MHLRMATKFIQRQAILGSVGIQRTTIAVNAGNQLQANYSLLCLCFKLYQLILKFFKSTDLDVCKICLLKQGNLFHDLCLVRSKILDSAFDSAIQLQLWETALQCGVPLIEPYKLWYGSEHPLTAILLLKLFKILLLTSQTSDSLALKYYEEAVKILELTHGKDSLFYRKEVKSLIHQM